MAVVVPQSAPEPRPTPVLDAALKCAAFGWFCFPCNTAKRPLIEKGCLAASTDTAQIKAWWAQFPHALIGIACGPSGIYVLDYDYEKDPDSASATRCQELTEGIVTREARSGSGGHHWYFTMPKEPLPNTAGKLGLGIDTRGDGGYVIIPPSTSDLGPYRWLNQAPLAEMPQRLIDALKVAETAPPRSGDGHIPVGQRNDALFRNACAMRRRGMSPLAIEAATLQDNRELCTEPLPDEQAREVARSALRYQPEPVTVVAPPVGQSTVALTAKDGVLITITNDAGEAASFAFTEMEKNSRDLKAKLMVRVAGVPDTCRRRINLSSTSAMDTLRKDLTGIYGPSFGWAKVLNRVFTEAEEAFLSQKRAIKVRDIPQTIKHKDIIETIMPAEGLTMIYGTASTNKSYLSLALALASTKGELGAGRYEVSPANVLYIDYEDSGDTFRKRTSRLLAGGELPEGLVYYPAEGVPLPAQWEAIKQTCEEEMIHWIIIDSVGLAAGGKLEDSETAIAFFNSLKRLGLPALLIAHKSKTSDGQTPFGSVFFLNLVRRAWHAEVTDGENTDSISIRLSCIKANEGRRPAPQYLSVTFTGDRDGPVYVQARPKNVEERSVRDLIYDVLSRGAKMSVQALATELSVTEFVIRKNLQSDQFIAFDLPAGASGGRPSQVYALKGREPKETLPF